MHLRQRVAPAATPTVAKFASLAVLLTGDFARTLSKCESSLSKVTMPGRDIFFVNSASDFAEVSLTRSTSFRDRQDARSGCPGVVGAVGADWQRRREALTWLQSRRTLQYVAAPAVAASVAALPADTLDLPPAVLLARAKALVQSALHSVVFSAQPPSRDDSSASASFRRRRPSPAAGAMAAVGSVCTSALRYVAALTVLVEQACAIVRGAPFFELAFLFTNRKRKCERRAAGWLASITRRCSPGASRPPGPFVWVDAEVERRFTQASSDALGGVPEPSPEPKPAGGMIGGSTAPMAADLLECLVGPAGSSADEASRLSLQEVTDVVHDVLIAGSDTTAATLATACLLLTQHPEAARRVAAEAAEAGLLGEAGRHEAFSAAVARPQALAYTRACVLEATRLHPAAPLLLRVALRDTTIGEVDVPEGSGVVASPACLGRDPATWDAPDAFRPERFLAGGQGSRGSAAEAARSFVAFGAGPRSCVGQQLAVCVASLALAAIVGRNAADAQ